jgi:hypothetical protein
MTDDLTFVSLGSIGAGFDEDSLRRAMDVRPCFLGADAGTNDVGPYQLGGVGMMFSEQACRRDLTVALNYAREAGIPLLVGSCGGSGRDAGVDLFARLIAQAAEELGLAPFTLATVYSEVEQDVVLRKLEGGRVRPLAGAPEYDSHAVKRSTRIVAVLGPEPYIEALNRGADVVLGGRTSDTAVFAAVPLRMGVPERVAWHTAKAAESGAAACTPPRMDCITLRMDAEGFTIEPASPALACTLESVTAVQLYENPDPTRFTEPPGVIDTTEVRYEQVSPRAVRVTGAKFHACDYTNKLEGVESAGFQSLVLASVRDPVALGHLDHWLGGLDEVYRSRANRAFGRDIGGEYTVTTRVYGRNGTLGALDPAPAQVPHEVMLVIDVVAADQATASAVANVVWHGTIHHESPGWRGGMTTAAWPFNPHVIDRGEVFRWNVHHVVEVDDPLELARISLRKVGAN